MASPLACTVRHCGLPLERTRQAYVCARGHSHDIARSGYLSLLQPQDRKSTDAGDSAVAVAARGRLIEAGIGRGLITEVVQAIAAAKLRDADVIADLGSGTGHALAAACSDGHLSGIGVDLSPAAARYASTRFRSLTWVVANADRRLPLIDRSLAFLLSLHGRRNPTEAARVLSRDGWLLVAVPAADDLIELRTQVQGHAIERSRVEGVVEEHAGAFRVARRFSVREEHTLRPDQLKDVLQSTYRGARHRLRENVEALSTLQVTLASDCVLLQRK